MSKSALTSAQDSDTQCDGTDGLAQETNFLIERIRHVEEMDPRDVSPFDRQTVREAFRSFSVAVGDHLAALSSEARQEAIAELQGRFLATFLRADGPRRFYEKPRGYAGDSASIEMIYDDQPSGTGIVGQLLDECFLAQPAAAAVRNRRGLMADQIRQAVQACEDGRAQVASLACGPAREIFDVLADPEIEQQTDFTCVDMDVEALDSVRQRQAVDAPDSSIQRVRENLLSVAFGRRELPVEPLDLAYSIGLIDYFEDRIVIKLLDALYDSLKPGGKVILGNFHTDNPDRGIMECFLEWNLIHRSEEDMKQIFAATRFGTERLEFVYEEEGVNLFAIAQKAPA